MTFSAAKRWVICQECADSEEDGIPYELGADNVVHEHEGQPINGKCLTCGGLKPIMVVTQNW